MNAWKQYSIILKLNIKQGMCLNRPNVLRNTNHLKSYYVISFQTKAIM